MNNITNLTNMSDDTLGYLSEISDAEMLSNEMVYFLDLRLVLSWLSTLIITLGVFTNLVSSIAFLNPSTLTSTNIYLTALCMCNSIALIGLLINSVLYSKFIYYEYLSGVKVIMYFYPFIYPLVTTSQIASIYLTVSVSINQFVHVAFHRGRRLKQNKQLQQKEKKRAFLIVLTIVFLSALFCVPYWFVFTYSNEYGLEKTRLSRQEYFNKIVHFYLYLPFACIIPFVILIITNTYLISTLELTNRRKQNLLDVTSKRCGTQLVYKLNSPDDLKAQLSVSKYNFSEISLTNQLRRQEAKFEKTNKTLMLVAVVFFFLICQSPTLLLHLIESLDQNYKNHWYYAHLVEFSKLLLIINLSFNFAIFYLFSKRFRQTLASVLCRRPNQQQHQQGTLTNVFV